MSDVTLCCEATSPTVYERLENAWKRLMGRLKSGPRIARLNELNDHLLKDVGVEPDQINCRVGHLRAEDAAARLELTRLGHR